MCFSFATYRILCVSGLSDCTTVMSLPACLSGWLAAGFFLLSPYSMLFFFFFLFFDVLRTSLVRERELLFEHVCFCEALSRFETTVLLPIISCHSIKSESLCALKLYLYSENGSFEAIATHSEWRCWIVKGPRCRSILEPRSHLSRNRRLLQTQFG